MREFDYSIDMVSNGLAAVQHQVGQFYDVVEQRLAFFGHYSSVPARLSVTIYKLEKSKLDSILNCILALSDHNWLVEDTPSSVANVKRIFDLMRAKLGLGVDASADEFANDNVPNKFTVLMILDKLYSIFKNHELIGN